MTTRELITSMEGIYRRRDRGELTGRNSNSTDRTLDARWAELQDELDAGGYEELDASMTLARRYARLERRHLLGKEGATA